MTSFNEESGLSLVKRNYILVVLVVVYTLNFVDRQILSILLELIKNGMGLSDSAMGFLTGFGFALFYATLGIPIALWADRSNRRNLIALALAIWSAMTALSGIVQNFWQLAIARIGVGIGESGCSPPSHSMIADLYSQETRATALGVYALGIPLGVLFGFIIGGWINQYFGWRMAFFVVGLPGLLLALLVRYTVPEPPRGLSDDSVPSKATTFSQTQGMVPLRMRAAAAAVLLFILNIIGLGMGPQAIGIVSDLLASEHGDESLRYSLLIFSSFNLWAAYHYYRAGKLLSADLSRSHEIEINTDTDYPAQKSLGA